MSSANKVFGIAACAAVLAACSMSMPSFQSAPPTEVLRIESEPPGADARTAEGQSCRTPCELTVPATAEIAVSFSLQGYNPQTISVRAEPTPGGVPGTAPTRLQPNPVYAELTPTTPQRPKRKSPPRKTVTKKAPSANPNRPKAAAPQPAAAPQAAPKAPPPAASNPAPASPSAYPWPPPPPPPK